VEPFFTFLSHDWWLAFPLMGVAGGAARAWEKNARGRHKRRLEILQAKSELKAAKTGAAAISPQASDATAGSSPLARVLQSHDDITARWLEYELNVGKMIAYPAMSDGRQPLTAAFLRAKRAADGLRPDSSTAVLTPEQLREYREAVIDYEAAFDVAERDARRLKDSGFTDAERRRLDTAQQLLRTAVDTAATPAERQLAYRRVREELDGLLSISDEAIDTLERRVALELPSHATERPDARS
jgi:hypothetical protein